MDLKINYKRTLEKQILVTTQNLPDKINRLLNSNRIIWKTSNIKINQFLLNIFYVEDNFLKAIDPDIDLDNAPTLHVNFKGTRFVRYLSHHFGRTEENHLDTLHDLNNDELKAISSLIATYIKQTLNKIKNYVSQGDINTEFNLETLQINQETKFEEEFENMDDSVLITSDGAYRMTLVKNPDITSLNALQNKYKAMFNSAFENRIKTLHQGYKEKLKQKDLEIKRINLEQFQNALEMLNDIPYNLKYDGTYFYIPGSITIPHKFQWEHKIYSFEPNEYNLWLEDVRFEVSNNKVIYIEAKGYHPNRKNDNGYRELCPGGFLNKPITEILQNDRLFMVNLDSSYFDDGIDQNATEDNLIEKEQDIVWRNR